jgi:hypothetical protein
MLFHRGRNHLGWGAQVLFYQDNWRDGLPHSDDILEVWEMDALVEPVETMIKKCEVLCIV